MEEGVIWMSIEIESEQVPREFYGLVASLNDLLVESEVPQCYIDRALDKIESIIAQALNHAEKESDDDEDSDEEADESDDDDEARKG